VRLRCTAWRNEIVDATVAAAKSGDARARAWVEAPTPLAVIVQRIKGSDQLVNEMAEPAIYRARWQDDEDVEEDNAKDAIRTQVAAELAERVEET